MPEAGPRAELASTGVPGPTDEDQVHPVLDPEPAVEPVARRRRATFACVFLPLVAIYSLTAQWGLPYHIDALTNAITGWYIGNEGTVVASEHDVLATPEQYAQLGWFVESPEGTVGQYPPGAALVAGLVYALTPGDMTDHTLSGNNFEGSGAVTVGIPPLWPATLSAVLTTAAAAAVLALVFQGLGGSRRTAAAGGLVFGLATGAWAVASTASWTHGPAMLAVALALLAVQRERWGAAGAAFAFAILTRPHLAVVAASVGLVVAWRRRTLRPAVVLGLTSGAGLLAIVAYNTSIWGEASISGGYGDGFERQFAHSDLGWFVSNVVGGLFDPHHGLLVWAPFLVVLAVAAVAERRHLVDWSTAAAVGGIAYLLIQWRANAFAGGEGHFAYRYPLEALTAAAPALYVGYERWVRPRLTAQRFLVLGLAVGFGGQLTASFS